MSEKLKNLNKTYLAFGIFALCIVVFYGNTLFNGFVFDDIPQIEQNPHVQSLRYVTKTITSCQWEYANKSCYGRSLYYRPLPFLVSILTYQISSEPWFFHLVNLLFFFGIACLLFILAKVLTKDFFIAFLSVLVFVIHPIGTEVVNWVGAIVELTFAALVLSSVILYIKFRETKRSSYLLVTYACYFLAVLSKEPALLLVAIFFLLDILFFKIPIKQFFHVKQLRMYAVFPLLFLLYFFMRLQAIGFSLGGGFVNLNFLEKVYATVTLFAQYIRLVFFPYPLSFFHNVQKSTEFLSLPFVGSFLVSCLFLFALIFLMRKRKRFLVFSMFWFLIFLSPVLIFLNAVGENMLAERYLFVPAIGFALAMAWSIMFFLRTYPRYFSKTPQRFVWLCLAIAVGAASWVVVYQRNGDWRTNETISLKTLSQNPNAHSVRAQLARWYLAEQKPEEAKTQFEELIKRGQEWKDITMAYKGVGDYYRVLGNEDKTLEYYVKATETSFSPRDYVVYNDVGVIYMDKGEYLKGFSYFCRSLQLLPENAATQQNFESSLGAIEAEYSKTGKLYEAIQEQFTKALTQKITFLDTKCEKESCQYAFAFRGDQQVEALPPFLIAAQTQTGKGVKILNKGFDQAASLIVLEVALEFQDKPMTVLFPSCSGTYYEAVSTSI